MYDSLFYFDPFCPRVVHRFCDLFHGHNTVEVTSCYVARSAPLGLLFSPFAKSAVFSFSPGSACRAVLHGQAGKCIVRLRAVHELTFHSMDAEGCIMRLVCSE